MTQRRPTDTGADYNAFGRDPYGWIAYLCALFFGPDYIPLVPRSQFGGAPEPPRYGPPARYQLSCLPAGFTPQYPNVNLVGIQESYAQGVDPIEMFDSRLCVWAQRFSRSERGESAKNNENNCISNIRYGTKLLTGTRWAVPLPSTRV